ncbi:MAG: alpha/beta fold hydrolase [Chitinophagales bacterium]
MYSQTDTILSPLYYRKMGAGPAVVLLHGFPESGLLWKNIWDKLPASSTLIIPDLPGSGNSKLESETSIDQMAGYVKTIMDIEGIDKAVIAGHSMGGYVALAFADRYPDRVSGLSLIHSTPLADDEEKKKLRLKSIELIRKGAKNTFISQMAPNLFSDAFKRSDPEVVKEQVEQALKMEDNSIVNFYTAMMQRPDRTNVLEKAVFPIQWIAGINDNLISYKKILEQCYKSDINFVSFYNNCGHMSMFEVPGQLISDLREFINYCDTYQHKRL